jgi:hypothetical protein
MAGLVSSIQVASALDIGKLIDFSVGETASGPYRVTDWQPRIVGDAKGKLQGYGSWPTWRDVRLLEITMEGSIVGYTPEDYWTARMVLAEALIPPVDYDRTLRHHGTMTIVLPTVGELWAYVNLVDYSVPLSHAGGTSSRCQFTWHADYGYWQQNDTAVNL